MAQHETVEVASYLRDGSLWAGRFVVDGGGLDFGDDRSDSLHGLAMLASAGTTRSSRESGRQVIACTRNGCPAAGSRTPSTPKADGPVDSLKRAA